MSEGTIDGVPTSERVVEILRAACRVIARDGAHGLRMEGVAREAGVSKALVHYYFTTRQKLLRAAFTYSEDTTWSRLEGELGSLEAGAARLERLLLLELDEDPLFEENRALWSEVYSSLGRDEELRPIVAGEYRTWVARLQELIEEGQRDGSIAGAGGSEELAWRLAAFVDGLESMMRLGLVTAERARELARATIADGLGSRGVPTERRG